MLKTFSRGGVHPQEGKISADRAIEVLALPKSVTIPVSQHLGAPSKAVVNKKDKVKVGQKIAESGGFISTNIHSSVSGTVSKIEESLDSSGYKKMSITIDVEEDIWEESIDRSLDLKKEIILTKEEIVKKILESGIVGLGGATFPTHVKYMVPEGKKPEYLILNGVECEPYLTSDHRLMMEKGEELIIGIKILMKALGVTKAIIGIENNKPDAINHLTKLVKNEPSITVEGLKVMYPQGGEKQLIDALLKREVPSGKLPIDVGCVVQNVGTAFAVYEAIQKNKPLIERVVTLTGPHVTKPANYLVRIGTPIQNLVEASGGIPEGTTRIINGGPMMGKALSSLEVPVVKGTSGILLLTEEDSKNNNPEQPCIRCAKCVSVCPIGLEPYLFAGLQKKAQYERLEKEHVMDCMECGCCSFTCPSYIRLLDYIRVGKNKVSKNIRSRK